MQCVNSYILLAAAQKFRMPGKAKTSIIDRIFQPQLETNFTQMADGQDKKARCELAKNVRTLVCTLFKRTCKKPYSSLKALWEN